MSGQLLVRVANAAQLTGWREVDGEAGLLSQLAYAAAQRKIIVVGLGPEGLELDSSGIPELLDALDLSPEVYESGQVVRVAIGSKTDSNRLLRAVAEGVAHFLPGQRCIMLGRAVAEAFGFQAAVPEIIEFNFPGIRAPGGDCRALVVPEQSSPDWIDADVQAGVSTGFSTL